MHVRVQLCQDPQTECALLRESLVVGHINHILWVHGRAILQEKRAAAIHDEVGQRSLERLFRGFTEESSEQATLSTGQSRIGYKGAQDIAGSSTPCGALTAAEPRIQAMTQDAAVAGLLPKPLETRLSAIIETATSTYLEALDGEDRAKRVVTNTTVSQLEHSQFGLAR